MSKYTHDHRGNGGPWALAVLMILMSLTPVVMAMGGGHGDPSTISQAPRLTSMAQPPDGVGQSPSLDIATVDPTTMTASSPTSSSDRGLEDGMPSLRAVPQLSNFEVTPSSGDSSTQFTFRVVYMDASNQAPTEAKVFIDTPYDAPSTGDATGNYPTYNMTRTRVGTPNYALGEPYHYYATTASFPQGMRLTQENYYGFKFSNAQGSAVAPAPKPTFMGPTVTSGAPNLLPTLTNPGVSPNPCFDKNDTTFSVTYTDSDGDPPITMDLYIEESDTYIGLSKYPYPTRNEVKTGVLYYHTVKPKSLVPVATSINYTFIANDGKGNDVKTPRQRLDVEVDPKDIPPIHESFLRDGNASTHAVTVVWNGSAWLLRDKLDFFVTYYDYYNIPPMPQTPALHIQEVGQPSTIKEFPMDQYIGYKYQSGMQYRYYASRFRGMPDGFSLEPGKDYQYRFHAQPDGYNDTWRRYYPEKVGGSVTWCPENIHVYGVNYTPPQLIGGTVVPKVDRTGDLSQVFIYTVQYRSVLGVRPQVAKIYVDGVEHDMFPEPNNKNWLEGVNFTYTETSAKLGYGYHNYSFRFADYWGEARYPSVGTRLGPYIPRPGEDPFHELEMVNSTITPRYGPLDQIYEFQVEVYSNDIPDPDTDMVTPPTVDLVLDGTLRYEVPVDRRTNMEDRLINGKFVDGESFYLQLSGEKIASTGILDPERGSHYFYFFATNRETINGGSENCRTPTLYYPNFSPTLTGTDVTPRFGPKGDFSFTSLYQDPEDDQGNVTLFLDGEPVASTMVDSGESFTIKYPISVEGSHSYYLSAFDGFSYTNSSVENDPWITNNWADLSVENLDVSRSGSPLQTLVRFTVTNVGDGTIDLTANNITLDIYIVDPDGSRTHLTDAVLKHDFDRDNPSRYIEVDVSGEMDPSLKGQYTFEVHLDIAGDLAERERTPYNPDPTRTNNIASYTTVLGPDLVITTDSVSPTSMILEDENEGRSIIFVAKVRNDGETHTFNSITVDFYLAPPGADEADWVLVDSGNPDPSLPATIHTGQYIVFTTDPVDPYGKAEIREIIEKSEGELFLFVKIRSADDNPSISNNMAALEFYVVEEERSRVPGFAPSITLVVTCLLAVALVGSRRRRSGQ